MLVVAANVEFIVEGAGDPIKSGVKFGLLPKINLERLLCHPVAELHAGCGVPETIDGIGSVELEVESIFIDPGDFPELYGWNREGLKRLQVVCLLPFHGYRNRKQQAFLQPIRLSECHDEKGSVTGVHFRP